LVDYAKIHCLVLSDDVQERKEAVDQIRINFKNLPDKDKEQAWEDLLELTEDEDSDVRRGAANALGLAFQYLADKEQAWNDLLALTKGKNTYIRVSSNYSLGKISIYRATEAESEERLKEEMNRAIRFFEKSSQETKYFNPAEFCLPFYRSYNAVISRQEDAEEEIVKNLKEAKQAVEGSKSKEKLLEAVENLANALQEAQKLKDLDEIKTDLNAYRRYCNRTVELLDETEDKAPGATKLMRRGLPIIDERIKELLYEIDNDTKILCDAAKGTEAEKYTNPTCEEVTKLVKIRNPIELDKRLNGFLPNLKFLVESLPEKERDFIYDKVEDIEIEEYLEDKLVLINEIIVFVVPYINMTKVLQDVWDKLDDITVFFDPAIQETITITIGPEILGTGIKRNITIPIREISYSEIRKDLERIKKECTLNFLPQKLAGKIKDYIKSKRNDIIKDLN